MLQRHHAGALSLDVSNGLPDRVRVGIPEQFPDMLNLTLLRLEGLDALELLHFPQHVVREREL